MEIVKTKTYKLNIEPSLAETEIRRKIPSSHSSFINQITLVERNWVL